MKQLKHKVLFVCKHNSARSQMAEAFLQKLGGEFFEVESAGLEPGKINPLVVEVMNEFEIDLSQKTTQSVFDLFRQGKTYHAVVTVCDGEAAERCPIFPGSVKRISWSFPDPSGFIGSRSEMLDKTRDVRDEILAKIVRFIVEAKEIGYWVK